MTLTLILKVTLILIAAAAAAALLHRRGSAAQRHLAWMLGLIAALILPWLPAISPTVAGASTIFALAAGASESAAASSAALPWLGWLWLAGFAAVLLRIALGHLRMARTTEVPMAMTWGILLPRILAPPAGLHPLDQQHEEAHIARHDGVWQLIAQLACAVYWFHPLVWWAERRAALERERACDDLVLAAAGVEAAGYAQRLVDVARLSIAPPPAAAALGFSSPSQLGERVQAILDPAARRHGIGKRDLACGIVLAALILFPLAPSIVAQPAAEDTKPKLTYKIEPEYTEEARNAKIEGTVHVKAVVKTDGSFDDIEVVIGIGHGLDEKAIEAIKEWRAEPARKNGAPVDALVSIEVNFRLGLPNP